MSSISRHVIVKGRVQGVAFRWATREKARELGLCGWVRNLADGRVELLVEGTDESVGSFLAWLAKGPPLARVAGLEQSESTPAGHLDFEILATAYRA